MTGLEDLGFNLETDGPEAWYGWEADENPLTLLFIELAKPLLRADRGSEDEVSEKLSKLETARIVDVFLGWFLGSWVVPVGRRKFIAPIERGAVFEFEFAFVFAAAYG